MITVLVVDDEQPIRSLLQRILTQHDIGVISAHSGADALRACSEHAIDVLLCDINMPDMNGVEVADAVERCWPAISIILMTGYAGRDVTALHPVVEKPFKPHTIVEKVRRAIDVRSFQLAPDHS